MITKKQPGLKYSIWTDNIGLAIKGTKSKLFKFHCSLINELDTLAIHACLRLVYYNICNIRGVFSFLVSLEIISCV